jgi:uracil phosphoribosyltransferase
MASIAHALVADRLAQLRDRATPAATFRMLVEELGAFVAYEAMRDLPVRAGRVTTPVAEAEVRRLAAPIVLVPVLRAGLGLLPGFLRAAGDAAVAHVGVFRDPQTLRAIPYYANVPEDLAGAHVFLLDPMLATGHSACAVLDLLAERGAHNIVVACLIAAAPGIEVVSHAHPSARIVTCAVDERLNEHGYIVPGLGDAGDRMFATATSVPLGHAPGQQRPEA